MKIFIVIRSWHIIANYTKILRRNIVNGNFKLLYNYNIITANF